ncbi:MAG: lysylphosphatidylglycerol synthase transmembrane domain-containing protein [Caldisericaceae bacterium]
MKNPENTDKKKLFRETFFAVIAGVLGIIIVSFFTHNFNIVSSIKAFKPSLLGLSFVLMLGNWLLEAYTLEIVANAVGYRLSFRECVDLFLVGGFFSRITPFGGGGGEPAQIIALAQRGDIKPGDSAAIVGIKVFISTFVRTAVLALLPVWLLISKSSWNLSENTNMLIDVGIAISLVLFSIFILALFKPEFVQSIANRILKSSLLKRFFPEKRTSVWFDKLKKIVQDFKDSRNKLFSSKKTSIYWTFFLSFVSYAFVLLTPVVLMRGLGVTSPWPEIVITALIFYASSSYIPTPGGSGTAELEMLALFARLIPAPLIGVFILTWRLFTHYFLLLFGGVFTLRKFKKKKDNS